MKDVKKVGEMTNRCSSSDQLSERDCIESLSSDEKAIYEMTAYFIKSFIQREEEKIFIDTFKKIKRNIDLDSAELKVLAAVERRLNIGFNITLINDEVRKVIDRSCLSIGITFNNLTLKERD